MRVIIIMFRVVLYNFLDQDRLVAHCPTSAKCPESADVIGVPRLRIVFSFSFGDDEK